MSLPRVFSAEKALTTGQAVPLNREDSNHLINVLRLVPGDRFELVDASGRLFLAMLQAGAATAQVLEILPSPGEPEIKVVLVQGLPKGDKMEYLIQKTTELGVAEIVPLAVEHCVVKYTPEKAAKKVERWQKVAQEAAKQSDRLQIPIVHPVQSLVDLEADNAFWDGLHLLAWEGSRTSLKGVLQETQEEALPERVVIYIGPEGSFSDQERESFIARGVQPISLGPRILRTETAGLAFLSMIMYEFDQIMV